MYDMELDILSTLNRITSDKSMSVKDTISMQDSLFTLINDLTYNNTIQDYEKEFRNNGFELLLKNDAVTGNAYLNNNKNPFYGIGWEKERGIILKYEGQVSTLFYYSLNFNWSPNFSEDKDINKLTSNELLVIKSFEPFIKNRIGNNVWECETFNTVGLNLYLTLFDRYGKFINPWKKFNTDPFSFKTDNLNFLRFSMNMILNTQYPEAEDIILQMPKSVQTNINMI